MMPTLEARASASSMLWVVRTTVHSWRWVESREMISTASERASVSLSATTPTVPYHIHRAYLAGSDHTPHMKRRAAGSTPVLSKNGSTD
jgi:hypothetical protein